MNTYSLKSYCRISLRFDTASSSFVRALRRKVDPSWIQSDSPFRINIFKVPLRHRVRCEQCVHDATYTQPPLEVQLGVPYMTSIPSMRTCVLIPFAHGAVHKLQEDIALSIQGEESLWDTHWRRDWDMEPIIWMGSKLTDVAASKRLEDLKRFYNPSEPVKLTLSGLTTSKLSSEPHNLLKEFPFLGWHGSGDPRDLDLSAAFDNGSRGAVS